jgi:hypothetical protein
MACKLPAVGGALGRMLCQIQALRFLTLIGIATGMTLGLLAHAAAQTLDKNSATHGQDPDTLVREVIRNEIEAQLGDNSLWCYREHEQEDGKPSRTLEVCETKEGDLERLLAVNGRELNIEQAQVENQRIRQAIGHPEQLRAKQKKEREDGDQQRNMLRIFPEAFRFQCETESGNTITLRFIPNPAFRPATRAATVFHHLEGTLVVDTKQKRMLKINGQLTSEVKFGGGLLGHLDKNGTFLVQQSEVSPGHWDLTHLNIHMSGRALFFKTINISEKKTLLDYRPLPRGTSLQQAADVLTRDFDLHAASSSSGK